MSVNSTIPLTTELELRDYALHGISGKFDLIVSNPPYLKLGKSDPRVSALEHVCSGAPNLYFLFATRSLGELRANGQMVYITPRSWTSGKYFARFRDLLFQQSGTYMRHIHYFESRDKVFTSEQVLQETMIWRVERPKRKLKTPPAITITTSIGNDDYEAPANGHFTVPYQDMVYGPEYYVFMVRHEHDLELLRALRTLPETLSSLGLKIHTRLCVDFRNKTSLRTMQMLSAAEPNSIIAPLLFAYHLKQGMVHFPVGTETADSRLIEFLELPANSNRPKPSALLQPNHNYLLLKRFSSKEEPCRLQCVIYCKDDLADYDYISTDNKVNFITAADGSELSSEVVAGLYVVYNSSFYDSYYRLLNGSTQVNASEFSSMPLPDLATITHMGRKLLKYEDRSTECCDLIIKQAVPALAVL